MFSLEKVIPFLRHDARNFFKFKSLKCILKIQQNIFVFLAKWLLLPYVFGFCFFFLSAVCVCV
jgi:hypothetical protein